MPNRQASLDVWISGSVRADLSLGVAERRSVWSSFGVLVATTPGYPQRILSRLDISILALPSAPQPDIEVEKYFDRFPVYLLPDTESICCRIEVLVG